MVVVVEVVVVAVVVVVVVTRWGGECFLMSLHAVSVMSERQEEMS